MTGKRGSRVSGTRRGSRVYDVGKVVAKFMTGERGSKISDGEKR